jgi:c-di-GMP-binding flagellar brake protein YcgR
MSKVSPRKSIRIDLSRYNHIFKYKLLAPGRKLPDEVFRGQLINLSKTGAQICGPIPSLKLFSKMGDEQVLIGCNFPLRENMVKVLARVRWAESSPSHGKTCHHMGIEFIKISENDKRILSNFLIHRQIKTSKFNRSIELLNPGS